MAREQHGTDDWQRWRRDAQVWLDDLEADLEVFRMRVGADFEAAAIEHDKRVQQALSVTPAEERQANAARAVEFTGLAVVACSLAHSVYRLLSPGLDVAGAWWAEAIVFSFGAVVAMLGAMAAPRGPRVDERNPYQLAADQVGAELAADGRTIASWPSPLRHDVAEAYRLVRSSVHADHPVVVDLPDVDDPGAWRDPADFHGAPSAQRLVRDRQLAAVA